MACANTSVVITTNKATATAMTFLCYLLFLVHTLQELKLTGNCLARSRPILSFDAVSIWHSYLCCFI